MRVLVTGAAGFIGGHLVRHYAAAGAEAIGLARPPARPGRTLRVDEPERWPDLVADVRPDLVFHCAGSSSVPRSLDDPLGDFRAGPALTAALLDAVRRGAPDARFVFLSSAAVYGEPRRLPIAETAPPRPISPYGVGKLQSELSCAMYAAIFGLRTASARIFSAYGPGLRRQVVWDTLARATAATGALALRGTGEETRDFLHVVDVVRALDLLARRLPLRGERCNVASGRETRIADLARIVAAAVGRPDLPAVFDGVETPGMPARWRADVARLEALGFAPTVDLAAGVAALAASRADAAEPA